jgi:lipopolysaccharide heptosyltransferase I
LKILILKPSSLGDVVHALPVLRLLKLRYPRSEIFWWLEAGLVPLLKDDPDLAGIFTFERKYWASPFRWPKLVRGVRDMRRERFDLAVDLQGLARSGLFTWLANAKTTVGMDRAPRGEPAGAREGAIMYYDIIAPRPPNAAHAVDRYLTVLGPLGVPVHQNFSWLPVRPGDAAVVTVKWAPEKSRWIALVPGARWNNKRWPVENFVALVKQLSPSLPGHKFVILGGAGDFELGQTISAAAPEKCLDLTGKTSLPEMIEWLRRTDLVITNDTGPMHLAAALKIPIIALFGPTNPDGTGPYGQRKNVLQATDLPCVPCLRGTCYYKEPLACLRRLKPEMVGERAQKQLQAIQKSQG